MTPKTMRAARYYGKEDVRIEHTPRPQLAPGQILIKPSHVGICGTDLHEYIAGPTYVCPLHSPPNPLYHPLTICTKNLTICSQFRPHRTPRSNQRNHPHRHGPRIQRHNPRSPSRSPRSLFVSDRTKMRYPTYDILSELWGL
jgi:hypothetical protein